MPARGETWIKTQTGWRTLKTIVISNRATERNVSSPISSDSEPEEVVLPRPHAVCGLYWQSGPPFVILPSDSRLKSEFFFISRMTSDGSTATSISTVFNKLQMKQSIKSLRRFNYVTKLLEVVLVQDLISTKSSCQKKLIILFEQLVNTVLSMEVNVRVVKRLLKVLKNRHLANKTALKSSKLWNGMLNQIGGMESRIDRFTVKKLCKGTNSSHMKLTDLPVEALRLILRCFSDHQDVANISLVNRYLDKLTKDAGLWKSLCLFHLPATKLKNVDSNVPSSWKTTYRNSIKRSQMRHTFAETMVICSHCHFIFWKFNTHDCSYDPKMEGKVPILIPITPKGFCCLFEK